METLIKRPREQDFDTTRHSILQGEIGLFGVRDVLFYQQITDKDNTSGIVYS